MANMDRSSICFPCFVCFLCVLFCFVFRGRWEVVYLFFLRGTALKRVS